MLRRDFGDDKTHSTTARQSKKFDPKTWQTVFFSRFCHRLFFSIKIQVFFFSLEKVTIPETNSSNFWVPAPETSRDRVGQKIWSLDRWLFQALKDMALGGPRVGETREGWWMDGWMDGWVGGGGWEVRFTSSQQGKIRKTGGKTTKKPWMKMYLLLKVEIFPASDVRKTFGGNLASTLHSGCQ